MLAANPAKFSDTMDPQEVLEWVIPCGPLLEDDEQIATFLLTIYSAAGLLGLTILGVGDGYPDPAKINGGRDISVWFAIDAAKQNDVAFDNNGTALPLNLHLVTDAAYARERDRDIVLQVAQRGV